MRRLALILALVLPALAVLVLGADVIDFSSWFESADDEDAFDESVWLDDNEDETGADGPSLMGRADPDALAAEARARAGAADGPDGGGALSGAAKGPGVPFKGLVVDPDGRPAEGVTVIAIKGGEEQRFMTDEDGRFDQALEPGRYRLTLRAQGLGYRLIRNYLVDGSSEDDLELSLRAPAMLTVAILRGDDGLADVPVSIVARGFEESADTAFAAVTGVDGVATFEEVPRATYDITAEVPDGPTIRQQQGLWADERLLKLQVPEAVKLQGKVTSGSDGPPVAGAEITLIVRALRGNGKFETSFVSGSDGTYDVMVPRGRPWTFHVTADGYAPWPNPASRGERKRMYRALGGLRKAKVVTLDVPMTSGASVVGQVTDETGKPVPGVSLRLKPRRGPFVVISTDDQGRYSAPELNADRYEILVETESWFAEQPLRFEVPAQQTQPITYDFVLHGARTFDGLVVSKAGKPAYGARVWIIGGGRPVNSARQAGRALEVFTDSKGTFRLTDVPRELSVSVRATHGDLEATPLWISKDKPVPASLRLQLEETGAIEGTCFDLLTRENVPSAKLVLRPVDAPGGRNGRTITVGKDGSFKLNRLIPGKWSLTPEKAGYLKSDPVVLSVPGSDRPTSMDVPLDPGLAFAGVVTDMNGRPLRKARVDVKGEANGAGVRGRNVQTNNQGRFKLTGYRRGTYQLTIRRGGFQTKVIQNLGGGEDRLVIVLDRQLR